MAGRAAGARVAQVQVFQPGLSPARGRRSEFEMGWTAREMPGVAAGALEREPWGEEEPWRTRVTIKPFTGGHKGENYVGTFFPQCFQALEGARSN